MRDFVCPNCGQHLTFENSICLSCGAALGFSLDDMALLVIAASERGHAGAVHADEYLLCSNLHLAECNWLVGSSRSAVRILQADPATAQRCRQHGIGGVRAG